MSEKSFPSFKSYGLNKGQVWEVINNYYNYMINMQTDLYLESLKFGSYGEVLSCTKDIKDFIKIKLVGDRLYDRFMEEDDGE